MLFGSSIVMVDGKGIVRAHDRTLLGQQENTSYKSQIGYVSDEEDRF